MVKKITNFGGPYSFLSNFHPSEVAWEGMDYPTVEHGFQAAKTDNLDDRRRIQTATSPGSAKALGRRVDLRSDWDSGYRLVVMETLLREKFTRHPSLGEKLLATSDANLVEGNTWRDMYWGVYKGRGQNHLGKLLMKIRAELADQEN